MILLTGKRMKQSGQTEKNPSPGDLHHIELTHFNDAAVIEVAKIARSMLLRLLQNANNSQNKKRANNKHLLPQEPHLKFMN